MARLAIRLCVVLLTAAVATGLILFAWTGIGGGTPPLHGLIALSLGVLGTVALTWGLMGLAFKSSREGWDDQPRDGSTGTRDDADKP